MKIKRWWDKLIDKMMSYGFDVKVPAVADVQTKGGQTNE